MDADFVPSSPGKTVSPHNYRYMKTLKQRKSTSFISKTSENLAPTNIYGGRRGVLFAPPPPPPPPQPFAPMFTRLYHYHQNQQPPLLPLPLIHQSSLPSIQNRGNFNSSSHPSYSHHHGFRKTRDQSLKPKKLTIKNKREESCCSSSPKKELKITRSTPPELVTMESTTNPLGPDPDEVHKEISDKLLLISSSSDGIELDKISGSVFSLSPPPSSLPLPKFSVRRCKAEAGGIDAGATDNLRRILRLR